MKKYIVTTTINPPEKTAYPAFVKDHSDWTLVIAGDIITDDELYREFVKDKNAVYLDMAQQEKLSPELHNYFGSRTDLRRMLANLYAYNDGADIIALIDDDNYPTLTWGKELLLKREISCPVYYNNNTGVLDPLAVIRPHDKIWHRGYPIDKVKDKNKIDNKISTIIPLVQEDFWYGDPDTDAFCRLTADTENFVDSFISDELYVFSSDGFSPFNSQNTFLHRDIVPYYFQFRSLGRMSDIWIAYYLEMLFAKPIVIYGKPTVTHIRGARNSFINLKQEQLGYLQTSELINDLRQDHRKFRDYVGADEWDIYMSYIERLHNVQ